NLSSLLSFFTKPHPLHGWAESWRLTSAMAGITMFQHHLAVKDGINDPHPLLTTVAFLAACAGAMALGVSRGRPLAFWAGAFGVIGGVLAVFSVTRVVDQPFHYLLLWMTVLPALPI